MASMKSRIAAAVDSCDNFLDVKTEGVPAKLLEMCKGVAILSITEASALLTASAGEGVLLRHNTETNKWSPPVSINAGGVGIGFAVGATFTDYFVVFVDDKPIRELAKGDKEINFSSEGGIHVGPAGRDAEFNLGSAGLIYSYKCSHGAFAGAKIDAAVFGVKKDTYREFYNIDTASSDDVSTLDVLYKEGAVKIPGDGSYIQALHDKLIMMTEGKTIERTTSRPYNTTGTTAFNVEDTGGVTTGPGSV